MQYFRLERTKDVDKEYFCSTIIELKDKFQLLIRTYGHPNQFVIEL